MRPGKVAYTTSLLQTEPKHPSASAYGRGLDLFITTYHLLDIVPYHLLDIVSKGRDEARLPYSMQWIRHHDCYDDRDASDAIH